VKVNNMPVERGKDEKGNWMRWGSKGKKYYWSTERGRVTATQKAQRQGQAIHASRGYRR